MILLAAAQTPYISVPAGIYHVGKNGHLDNDARTVHLRAFEIARLDTTNAEFAVFVKATGYVTDAERLHNAMVFEPPLREFRWIHDPTAFWRFPNGRTRGGIDGKMDHPVTAISFHDATVYCKWAGVRLPTLDEWEVASRAGAKTDYFFGDTPDNIAQYANVWHGRDHLKPDNAHSYAYPSPKLSNQHSALSTSSPLSTQHSLVPISGTQHSALSTQHSYTSPVGHFLPNPWGLYDVYGNVFQFCTGRVPTDRSPRTRHARGGSWWCSRNACCFFNSVDIGSADLNASFSNQGFRVARDIQN